MAFLDQHPGLGYPLASGLGLLLGSFLNVVILRLPRRLEWQWKRDAREIMEMPDIYDPPPPGIVVEPSHDPVTGDRLKWWENIPVLSWLLLRGRSRYSGKSISLQYPLVELLTCLLVLASVWRFGFGWHGFGAIVFSCFLVALAGIDLRTRLLPDQLTLMLMWLGLIGSADNLFMAAKPALLGAVVGYLSLWIVAALFKLIFNKEGMGHGDFKMLAALGAWCGLKGILPIILISSLAGVVLGSVWLVVRGHNRTTMIPFGPYLAVGGWIVFFFGDQIIHAYLELLSIG
ncbi:prepilin peptidase [Xylella fastidiosa]|uniref:prepilin peptidase n=1 Tax=Xylella fastidiosa TaxID=2371 RepID=UPI0009835B3C|nr:A24 family peptidase [Xylella fastidiosa]ALR09635.2 methyltransferase [Xylella fastidiosa]WGZ31907.1 A24 family peptidase [Xylella fastidiosa subsp. pauca]WGZ34174.1 A24 family peptidase [Xylella fastidiosa subsp. pauca]WGZ36466.1 A24 family peptidase [Xylella fastidiosa subsp. pauca]